MRHATLKKIDLPDLGAPTVEPALSRELYSARLARLRQRLAAQQLDALVIYGDREHMANIAWASNGTA